MKKNDMVVVTIEDIGINGEGIGKLMVTRYLSKML